MFGLVDKIRKGEKVNDKIIDYGNEIGTCVCDRDTCLYVCEEMKKEYNFSDNCKDVCVPSECFRVMIW